MPTIRYLRTLDGALKMNKDGHCWADCVLWAHGGMESAKEGMRLHPGMKARNFVMTLEDVGRPTKCGYCGNCMTEEEMREWVKNH